MWSPHGRIQLQAVEQIQRNFTTFALHYPDLSYKERCSLLDILPLCYHREICDLNLYVPSFCDGMANIVKPVVPNVRLRSKYNGIHVHMKAYHFKTKALFYQ